MLFGTLKTRFYQINLVPGCRYPLLRLLLKGMQHVDRVFESNSIDSSIGIAAVMTDNFDHAAAAESFERPCRGMLAALLGAV